MFTQKMSEEQFKQAIYDAYFTNFVYKPDFGQSRIDFVLANPKDEVRHILWAEVKNEPTEPIAMLTQLILTIKKTWGQGDVVPPAFLAVMDTAAFTFYNMADFSEVLLRNDIDWRATPSNYKTEAFAHLKAVLPQYITVDRSFALNDPKDMADLPNWITLRLGKNSEMQAIDITLANLNHVFNKWCDVVRPQIGIDADRWSEFATRNIYASDFFLAGLYVDTDQNETLVHSLKVIFRNGAYYVKEDGQQLMLDDDIARRITFKDDGTAYAGFWKMYKRPPRQKAAYAGEKTPWGEILARRDILVPRDVMERKGAFFTPRIWVDKAHQYLADALGENWQDEYIIYDCAAGSGNLLAGLYNKRNVYASTIDEADCRIMISETKPTFAKNIFQFDFLNDEFIRQSHCAICKDLSGKPVNFNSKDHRKQHYCIPGKVPDALMDVLECTDKRKKIVFLINPPYAEGDANAKDAGREGRGGIGETLIKDRYKDKLGKASAELFAQFLARIYGEFRGCIIAEFSKLKVMQAPNFKQMREWFKPMLLSCFVVPGNTFENVKGSFPIGLKIWD